MCTGTCSAIVLHADYRCFCFCSDFHVPHFVVVIFLHPRGQLPFSRMPPRRGRCMKWPFCYPLLTKLISELQILWKNLYPVTTVWYLSAIP